MKIAMCQHGYATFECTICLAASHRALPQFPPAIGNDLTLGLSRSQATKIAVAINAGFIDDPDLAQALTVLLRGF